MSDSGERKAFKDYFDAQAARALGRQIEAVYPDFDAGAFRRRATRGLAALEFQDRVHQFADAFAATLPERVPEALQILTKSLPPALPDCEAVTDGWLQWPIGHYIARYGTGHFAASMRAMEALTQRFSSEFAVRPFVEAEPERTLAHLQKKTTHRSPHVRRWCSEGIRPRLPWGRVLRDFVANPAPIWPILEALRDDPERYVLRSVANNINDIAKDHPDLVVEHMEAWSADATPERTWCIRHGLRTLIKDGHPGALALAGYGTPRQLDATLRVTPGKIPIGGAVQLEAILETHAGRAQELLVDYVVRYVRSKGKTGDKVFKWKTLTLPARGSQRLTKKHNMKVTTIRRLYPGRHEVFLQVNGRRVASTSFELRDA